VFSATVLRNKLAIDLRQQKRLQVAKEKTNDSATFQQQKKNVFSVFVITTLMFD